MNGRAAKQLRVLVAEENPAILLAIRTFYGEKTENMNDIQLYRAAKKLYSNGSLGRFFLKKEQNKNS